jgi:hypothetical protein
MNEDLFEDLRIENSNLEPDLKKRYFTDEQFELMSETERFRVM